MRKMRSGFTFIEVSLFLAITGLVFVGIAVGTQNSIFWQRYNDSVQSFAEFLRSEYSRVANVQLNAKGKNEGRIALGRVILFDKNGNINSYLLSVGEKAENASGGVKDWLKNGSASPEIDKNVGISEKFTPRWGAQIQTTKAYNGGYEPYMGAIMIVRHPSNGTIYTFVNSKVKDEDALKLSFATDEEIDGYESTQVDFCVNPNGADKSNLRRDVRIIKDARNASGVEVVTDSVINNDSGENEGNRCAE